MKKIIFVLFIGVLIPVFGVARASTSASAQIKDIKTQLKNEVSEIRAKGKAETKNIREVVSSTIAEKKTQAIEKINTIRASSTEEKMRTVAMRTEKINAQLEEERKKQRKSIENAIAKHEKALSEIETKLKVMTGLPEDIASVRADIILEKNAIDSTRNILINTKTIADVYKITVSSTSTLLKDAESQAQIVRKQLDGDIKKVKSSLLEIQKAEKILKVDFSKLTKPKKGGSSTSTKI